MRATKTIQVITKEKKEEKEPVLIYVVFTILLTSALYIMDLYFQEIYK